MARKKYKGGGANVYDRDVVLRCPFCHTALGGPLEVETPFGDTVEGGFCGCGAAFVFDRSGKKLGEAYMDALSLAFNWDIEAALNSGADGYEEGVVRHDTRSGKYFLGDGGRFDRNPKYYFVRKKKAE
ncbi:MAG: hypothetical protein P8Y66_03025 [Nitrospirota bacterium]|jgi:hypothetical protein